MGSPEEPGAMERFDLHDCKTQLRVQESAFEQGDPGIRETWEAVLTSAEKNKKNEE